MPLDFMNNILGFRPPPMNMRTAKGIVKDLGMLNISASAFKKQNYSDLKNGALHSQRLFEDEQFPCAPSSLFYSRPTLPVDQIVWLRPKVRGFRQSMLKMCI